MNRIVHKLRIKERMKEIKMERSKEMKMKIKVQKSEV